MIKRTFIDKFTTIVAGSKDNFGLNPIGALHYGDIVSRCLLHFDESGLENIPNAKHVLKLTNCSGIDKSSLNDVPVNGIGFIDRERATSFDVLAFRIPEFWDAGRGFDNSDDFWFIGKSAVSQHGANWYFAYDGKEWGTEIDDSGHTIPVQGVLSNETLAEEYEKYSRGEESLIIGRQHFDRGNENLEIDITDYVNSVLTGETTNFGIGLVFSPALEASRPEKTQYVGFFTNNTNTFFQPVVESRATEVLNDNRYNCYLGKTNKIYFYAVLGGVPADLDELPVCEIDGEESPVYRQNTGIYYTEVKYTNKSEENTIHYDTWSNLKYEGEELEDVEMEFVVLPKQNFFSLGEASNSSESLEPTISGINDNEKIFQGDERTLNVIFRKKYSSEYNLVGNCQYRIYVKDGKREITVVDWDNIDTCGKFNTFKLNSAEYLPAEYHIDIKAKIGNDTRIFKNKLTYTIVDNITNIKR